MNKNKKSNLLLILLGSCLGTASLRATRGVMVKHVCFHSLSQMYGFEFGVEFSGFSIWHFFKAHGHGVSSGTPVSSSPLSVNGFSQ